MTGYYFSNQPFWEHDCEKCRYLYSIKISRIDGNKPSTQLLLADVYESCDNSHFPWLVRYGTHGDYVTIDLRTLFCHFLRDIHGLKV